MTVSEAGDKIKREAAQVVDKWLDDQDGLHSALRLLIEEALWKCRRDTLTEAQLTFTRIMLGDQKH